jgi:hypothetical protein
MATLSISRQTGLPRRYQPTINDFPFAMPLYSAWEPGSASIDVAIPIAIAVIAAAGLPRDISDQGTGYTSHGSADRGTANIAGCNASDDRTGSSANAGALFRRRASRQTQSCTCDHDELVHVNVLSGCPWNIDKNWFGFTPPSSGDETTINFGGSTCRSRQTKSKVQGSALIEYPARLRQIRSTPSTCSGTFVPHDR